VTFSIVAHDPGSGSLGVAVASKFLAVGHVVPWGAAGVGALAVQATTDMSYGPLGLALLGRGRSAQATLSALLAPDPLADERQVGVVEAAGGAASYTGSGCLPWCGGLAEDGLAVQGNILAGPGVVEAMRRAYRASTRERFSERLLEALVAGDRAGGDRRGRQSAALRVWRAGASYGGTLDIAVDLRVDDHRDPLGELARLEQLHALYFGHPDPDTLLPLAGELRQELTALLRAVGRDPGGEGGLEAALADWVSTENYEERHVAGAIDPLVLEQLRRQAGA